MPVPPVPLDSPLLAVPAPPCPLLLPVPGTSSGLHPTATATAARGPHTANLKPKNARPVVSVRIKAFLAPLSAGALPDRRLYGKPLVQTTAIFELVPLRDRVYGPMR